MSGLFGMSERPNESGEFPPLRPIVRKVWRIAVVSDDRQ